MPKPIARLPEEFVKLDKLVKTGSERLVKRATKACAKTLVDGTPVDTGVARAGWEAGLDGVVSDSARIPRYPKGSKAGGAGRGETLVRTETLAKIAQNVAPFDSRKNRFVTIQNQVDYIGLLNNGSSRQGPSNFVELAVQAATLSVVGQKVINNDLAGRLTDARARRGLT